MHHLDFGSVYHCLHCSLPPSGETEAHTIVLSALQQLCLPQLKLVSSDVDLFHLPLCRTCPLGLSVQGVALSAVA